MQTSVKEIAGHFLSSRSALVFTGAGISTESNIPDYRSKGGIWEKFKPVYFDEFMSKKGARIEYWRRKSELYHQIVRAEPNPAHKTITELHEKGLVKAVITQNIDGLHQKAGLPEEAVIELHGNNLRVRCMSCNETSSIHEAQKRIEEGDSAPECECGGYLKPDTVSFGQSLPAYILANAEALAGECDFFLVIGSTLLVQPAATLPILAKENGAFLAIINLSETPCDEMCDVLIREKAGDMLPRIAAEIRSLKGWWAPKF